MWLAHAGDCVHVFTGHEGPVTCGLFTSDGKAIASGMRTRPGKWPLTHSIRRSPQLCPHHITSRHVTSGSEDGSVRVWGPKLGVCKHVFSGYGFHEGAITALASHPTDGALLLTGPSCVFVGIW